MTKINKTFEQFTTAMKSLKSEQKEEQDEAARIIVSILPDVGKDLKLEDKEIKEINSLLASGNLKGASSLLGKAIKTNCKAPAKKTAKKTAKKAPAKKAPAKKAPAKKEKKPASPYGIASAIMATNPDMTKDELVKKCKQKKLDVDSCSSAIATAYSNTRTVVRNLRSNGFKVEK